MAVTVSSSRLRVRHVSFLMTPVSTVAPFRKSQHRKVILLLYARSLCLASMHARSRALCEAMASILLTIYSLAARSGVTRLPLKFFRVPCPIGVTSTFTSRRRGLARTEASRKRR